MIQGTSNQIPENESRDILPPVIGVVSPIDHRVHYLKDKLFSSSDDILSLPLFAAENTDTVNLSYKKCVICW